MDRAVKTETISKALSFTRISLQITCLGDDCHLLLWGGDTPHLGCSVLAVPRPSLTGTGSSVTSSVLNRVGHKDEHVCRRLGEKVAAATGRVVVCSGGIHIDRMTAEQLEEIAAAVEELGDRAIRGLTAQTVQSPPQAGHRR